MVILNNITADHGCIIELKGTELTRTARTGAESSRRKRWIKRNPPFFISRRDNMLSISLGPVLSHRPEREKGSYIIKAAV